MEWGEISQSTPRIFLKVSPVYVIPFPDLPSSARLSLPACLSVSLSVNFFFWVEFLPLGEQIKIRKKLKFLVFLSKKLKKIIFK